MLSLFEGGSFVFPRVFMTSLSMLEFSNLAPAEVPTKLELRYSAIFIVNELSPFRVPEFRTPHGLSIIFNIWRNFGN